MVSSGDSRYFSGTTEDGKTPSANLVSVEVQALAALILEDDCGFDNMERCRAKDGGYAYDNANLSGSWLEGTAMAALAYERMGEEEKADLILEAIEGFQLPSGAIPQASLSGLSTGEKDRVLNDWPCVGATAWFVLAANGTDPFAIG